MKQLFRFHLDLSDNKICYDQQESDPGFEIKLPQTCQELSLNFQGNKLFDVNELGQNIQTLEQLQKLNLNFNSTNIPYPMVVYMVTTVYKLKSLRYISLSLENNNYDPVMVNALYKQLNYLPNLNFLQLFLQKNILNQENLQNLMDLSNVYQFLVQMNLSVPRIRTFKENSNLMLTKFTNSYIDQRLISNQSLFYLTDDINILGKNYRVCYSIKYGFSQTFQEKFRCLTCEQQQFSLQEIEVCKNCALGCHQGHLLIPVQINNKLCKCIFTGNCFNDKNLIKVPQDIISRTYIFEGQQNKYICMSCSSNSKQEFACNDCKDVFHQNHLVQKIGFKKFICQSCKQRNQQSSTNQNNSQQQNIQLKI